MSSVDISLTIVGQAGQGVHLISRLLGLAFVRSGYQVFVSQDVMSRIRGGDNSARIRVSDRPVAADADAVDVLVALDAALAERHLGELGPGGCALVNGETGRDGRTLRLPLAQLAQAHGGPQLQNSVAAGVLLALLGADTRVFAAVLRDRFGAKGDDIVAGNVAAAEAGHNHLMEQARDLCLAQALAPRESGKHVLVSGCEALALGAIAANVRVVAGYPMSPGTPILEYCSIHSLEVGVVVEQSEDEIAAVNLALGASFAGVRSLVATAGGGFALMNEALSLAGITETPIVICAGMRPGPATGMATRTAQADLLTSIYAGHGEFPRVVLAPADAVAGFRLVQDAFCLADKYQMPAIVLFDQFLGDSFWTVPASEFDYRTQVVPAPSVPDEAYSYKRYALTEDGVSPRLVPGTPRQLVCADSDEHSEEGHIVESSEARRLQADKRGRKLRGLAAELPAPVRRPGPAGADVVFCFGSSRGVVREAVERLRVKHPGLDMVHLDHMWPFPAQAILDLCGSGCRVFTVEGNHTGQLAQLLTQECRLRVSGTVRRYDGRPLRVGEVEQGLEALLVKE